MNRLRTPLLLTWFLAAAHPAYACGNAMSEADRNHWQMIAAVTALIAVLAIAVLWRRKKAPTPAKFVLAPAKPPKAPESKELTSPEKTS